MGRKYGPKRTRDELDEVAWRFLRSEFAGPTRANWPIERRIDAYLLHDGPRELLNDGSTYAALVQHVMANVRSALRIGLLSPSAT